MEARNLCKCNNFSFSIQRCVMDEVITKRDVINQVHTRNMRRPGDGGGREGGREGRYDVERTVEVGARRKRRKATGREINGDENTFYSS